MTGVGSRHRPRRDWKPVAASVTRPRMSLVLQSFLPFPHSCQCPSPHQQGRDERMIEQCFGGIAVRHVVPVCFVLSEATVYITIDEKPKAGGGPLKRLANITENPAVAFVSDRYHEDWS